MNINEIKMCDASKQQLADSLKIRSCSYDPTEQLELNCDTNGSMLFLMPLSCKKLWFFTYCQEKGKKGKVSIEHTDLNGAANLGFISSKATVYIDEEVVGEGYAGRGVDLNSLVDMTNCIQSVTGMALSKALSNAGFGIVEKFYVDSSPVPSSETERSEDVPVPFDYQEPAENAKAAPTPSKNSAPTANIAPPSQRSEPGQEEHSGQMSAFEMLGGKVDPLTQAKSFLYPINGRLKGSPLGQMKTAHLEYLVSNYSTTSDPSVAAAVNAAKLILNDRLKASGKAAG